MPTMKLVVPEGMKVEKFVEVQGTALGRSTPQPLLKGDVSQDAGVLGV